MTFPSQDPQLNPIWKDPLTLQSNIHEFWGLGPDIFGGHYSAHYNHGWVFPIFELHLNGIM